MTQQNKLSTIYTEVALEVKKLRGGNAQTIEVLEKYLAREKEFSKRDQWLFHFGSSTRYHWPEGKPKLSFLEDFDALNKEPGYIQVKHHSQPTTRHLDFSVTILWLDGHDNLSKYRKRMNVNKQLSKFYHDHTPVGERVPAGIKSMCELQVYLDVDTSTLSMKLVTKAGRMDVQEYDLSKEKSLASLITTILTNEDGMQARNDILDFMAPADDFDLINNLCLGTSEIKNVTLYTVLFRYMMFPAKFDHWNRRTYHGSGWGLSDLGNLDQMADSIISTVDTIGKLTIDVQVARKFEHESDPYSIVKNELIKAAEDYMVKAGLTTTYDAVYRSRTNTEIVSYATSATDREKIMNYLIDSIQFSITDLDDLSDTYDEVSLPVILSQAKSYTPDLLKLQNLIAIRKNDRLLTRLEGSYPAKLNYRGIQNTVSHNKKYAYIKMKDGGDADDVHDVDNRNKKKLTIARYKSVAAQIVNQLLDVASSDIRDQRYKEDTLAYLNREKVNINHLSLRDTSDLGRSMPIIIRALDFNMNKATSFLLNYMFDDFNVSFEDKLSAIVDNVFDYWGRVEDPSFINRTTKNSIMFNRGHYLSIKHIFQWGRGIYDYKFTTQLEDLTISSPVEIDKNIDKTIFAQTDGHKIINRLIPLDQNMSMRKGYRYGDFGNELNYNVLSDILPAMPGETMLKQLALKKQFAVFCLADDHYMQRLGLTEYIGGCTERIYHDKNHADLYNLDPERDAPVLAVGLAIFNTKGKVVDYIENPKSSTVLTKNQVSMSYGKVIKDLLDADIMTVVD